MFTARVDKNSIVIEGDERITSGSVNTNYIRFEFTNDWAGLKKTALFSTKKVCIPIILNDDKLRIPIPWEVMAYAKEDIKVGVYGTRVDNPDTEEIDEELILPTVWTTIPNRVEEGVKCESCPPNASKPTPDSYFQLLEYIETLLNSGVGGGGTPLHDKLLNRELPDQHPIDAITGLRVFLDGFQQFVSKQMEMNESQLTLNGAFHTNIDTVKQVAASNTEEIAKANERIDNISLTSGEDGATFTPSVSDEGVISWTNDKGLENPVSVDIRGPQGLRGENGTNGTDGEDGATFTPNVTDAGDLSWTNDKGLPNPPTVNIKGPPGVAGEGDGGTAVDIKFDSTMVEDPETGVGVKYPIVPIGYTEYEQLTDAEKQDIAFIVDGMPAESDIPVKDNVYSEEEVVIGTWFGKPLYRRVINVATGSNTSFYSIVHPLTGVEVTRISGWIMHGGGGEVSSREFIPSMYCEVLVRTNGIALAPNNVAFANRPCTLIFEYTKTTDQVQRRFDR